MAVAFDNVATASGGATTVTLTTPAFTISGANRAACVALHWDNGAAVTGITAACGGVSGSAVASTDGTNYVRTAMFAVIAPATGSQTATASWTTGRESVLSVVTATGVHQTTPMNNGTWQGSIGIPSFAITSTSGDLTLDALVEQDVPSGPNQTERYNVLVSNIDGAGSTGPGTGTTTHSWATSGASWSHSGANFVQVAAAAAEQVIHQAVYRGVERR